MAVAHLFPSDGHVSNGGQGLQGRLDDVARGVVGQFTRGVVLEADLEAALQVPIPGVGRQALHLDARVQGRGAPADRRLGPDAVPLDHGVGHLGAALVLAGAERHPEGGPARGEEVELAGRVRRLRRRLEAGLRRRGGGRVAVGVRREDARRVVLARRQGTDGVAAVGHGAVVVRARRRVHQNRVRAQGPAVQTIEVRRRVPLHAVPRDLRAAVAGGRVEEDAQGRAAVHQQVRVDRRVRLLPRRRQRRRLRRPRLRGAQDVHRGDAHGVRLAGLEVPDHVRVLPGLALERRVHHGLGVARRRRARYRRAAQHVRVGHGRAVAVRGGDVGDDLGQRELEPVDARDLVGPLLARGAQ